MIIIIIITDVIHKLHNFETLLLRYSTCVDRDDEGRHASLIIQDEYL